MGKKTTNLQLIKPELTDAADITTMNENWDKIDASINDLDKRVNDASTKGHKHSASDITSGTLPIARGGTDASDAKTAREKLGIPTYVEQCIADANLSSADHKHSASDITSGTLPIARGGTGATTAAQARQNLGVAASKHTHYASDINYGTLPIARGGTGASSANGALEALGVFDLVHEASGVLNERIDKMFPVPTENTAKKLTEKGYYHVVIKWGLNRYDIGTIYFDNQTLSYPMLMYMDYVLLPVVDSTGDVRLVKVTSPFDAQNHTETGISDFTLYTAKIDSCVVD